MQIKTSLELVTDVVSEIKLSLEEMCKDLKSSNFQCNKERRSSQKSSRLKNRQDIEEYSFNVDSAFKRPNTFDIPLSKRYENSANNLKFVLYMYEVKKMRDIYGRVTMALDIVQHKK